MVRIDQVECMVTTISEDGERKNKKGTRAREKAGGFSRFLRCYTMGVVIVTAILFGYTSGRQGQGIYGSVPEVHQGAGHRDPPDVSGVFQAGHQSGVAGSAEEAQSAPCYSQQDREQAASNPQRRRTMEPMAARGQGYDQEAESKKGGTGSEVARGTCGLGEKRRGIEKWSFRNSSTGNDRIRRRYGGRCGQHAGQPAVEVCYEEPRSQPRNGTGSGYQPEAHGDEGEDGSRVSAEVRIGVHRSQPVHATAVPISAGTDDGSRPSTTAGGRDGSSAKQIDGENRCWSFHKTPRAQEQRKITIFQEPGNHAAFSGEESWPRLPEGRVAYEAETGGVKGMRIVPISSLGFEELWHLWDKCHDRVVTFLLMIVGDIVIFLATIMWMILRCRPRSRRLVCISQIRYCRPGKKVKERRFWKPSLLWLLYLQGTHPGALQVGWQVVSAANVPVSSLFTEDAQSEPFDEMVLMAVSGDGTQQDDNVFAPPSQPLLENPEVVMQEEANDVNGDEDEDEELQSSEDEGSSFSQHDDDDLQ